jgi:hypothetical protein
MGAWRLTMLKKETNLLLCLLALANTTLSSTVAIAADLAGDEEVGQAQEAQKVGDQAKAENK